MTSLLSYMSSLIGAIRQFFSSIERHNGSSFDYCFVCIKKRVRGDEWSRNFFWTYPYRIFHKYNKHYNNDTHHAHIHIYIILTKPLNILFTKTIGGSYFQWLLWMEISLITLLSNIYPYLNFGQPMHIDFEKIVLFSSSRGLFVSHM